jgi:ubiquinone/menaquinone biosynthesis C-methylase UbiE
MTISSSNAMPVRAFSSADDLNEQADFFVRFLDALHRLPGIQANHKRTVEMLEICEGYQLLDVGCGAGSYSHDVFPLVGDSGRIVGLDQSREFIEVARRRADALGMSIEYVVGDVNAMSFPDDSFDGSRIERVLQYVDDPLVALSEMVRVTKPGGHVVASEIDWDAFVMNFPGLDRNLYRWTNAMISDGVGNGWIGRELRNLFLDAGLEDVETEGHVMIITDAKLFLDDLAGRSTIFRAHRDQENGREVAEQLIADIEAASQKDRFLRAGTMFTVSGRVPN